VAKFTVHLMGLQTSCPIHLTAGLSYLRRATEGIYVMGWLAKDKARLVLFPLRTPHGNERDDMD